MSNSETAIRETKKPSRTRLLANELIHMAFGLLIQADGSMPISELKSLLEKKMHFDEWANEFLSKSGNPRWGAILHFYSIDCVKAGFLVKNKGIWSITPEGIVAHKRGPTAFLDLAIEKYREWRKSNPKVVAPSNTGELEVDTEEDITQVEARSNRSKIEQIELAALEELRQYIKNKNAYEFQDLVGALLRGMGYFTPFIAPKGKDGGVDLIAYKDPLGTTAPRMKVQVKHRDNSATVQELRELTAIIRRGDDVGIFVSTGGFTSEAWRESRSSDRHIELIDFERFISLWQDFYSKMNDEDRLLLPLHTISFLAPED
jgi:restriction system protein